MSKEPTMEALNPTRVAVTLAVAPLIFILAAGLMGALNGQLFHADSMATLLTLSATAIALTAVAILLLAGVRWGEVASTLQLKKPPLRFVLAGILVAVGVFAVNIVITAMLPGEAAAAGAELQKQTGASYAVAAYLFVPLVAPLFEELLTRGALMGVILRSKSFPRWLAVVLPAIAFSLMHFQGASTVADGRVLLVTLLSGLAFGYLAYRAKSIWPAVIAHGGQNLLVVLVALAVS